jgi:hypothetical protein
MLPSGRVSVAAVNTRLWRKGGAVTLGDAAGDRMSALGAASTLYRSAEWSSRSGLTGCVPGVFYGG